MSTITNIEVRRTYKYRLYTSKRDFRLHDTINIAGILWNHLTALQKRYYRRFKKHISEGRMKSHIAKLRMKTTRFSHWRKVGSQAVQEICEKYRQITIRKTAYKFVYHRPLQGAIQTVTIKRDAAERLWGCFSVLETLSMEQCSTGKIGAFGFGLKVFLTTETGQVIEHPLFYREDLPRLQQIQRRDFHFKQANQLCDLYDILIFEDLHVAAMKKLWGRKVSDLGFTKFLTILKWVALKRGKKIITISRFERTTGKCSGCHHQQNLELSERTFCCQKCGLSLDRDHNAALNILEAGHRLMLSQSEEDRVKNKASDAKGRRPTFRCGEYVT